MLQEKIEVIREHAEIVGLLPTLDISLSDLLSESIEVIEQTLTALEKEYHI